MPPRLSASASSRGALTLPLARSRRLWWPPTADGPRRPPRPGPAGRRRPRRSFGCANPRNRPVSGFSAPLPSTRPHPLRTGTPSRLASSPDGRRRIGQRLGGRTASHRMPDVPPSTRTRTGLVRRAAAFAWLRSSPPWRPGRPQGTKRSTRPNPKHASRLAFAFDDGSTPQVALHASSFDGAGARAVAHPALPVMRATTHVRSNRDPSPPRRPARTTPGDPRTATRATTAASKNACSRSHSMKFCGTTESSSAGRTERGFRDSLDDEQEPSVGSCDHRRSRERAAPHGALPAMRAITHVVGKAIRSSRRARRGAGSWLRRTIGASGRTPMSSNRMTWRRASAARRPLIGSACPDGRRGGKGFARRHSGRSRDVRPRPPVCAGGRGRRHAHGRRARVSSGAGVGSGQWRRRLIKGAAAQRPAARSSHCSDSSNSAASAKPSGAPGLLLCQEAGVSPCAPAHRPQRARRTCPRRCLLLAERGGLGCGRGDARRRTVAVRATLRDTKCRSSSEANEQASAPGSSRR